MEQQCNEIQLQAALENTPLGVLKYIDSLKKALVQAIEVGRIQYGDDDGSEAYIINEENPTYYEVGDVPDLFHHFPRP